MSAVIMDGVALAKRIKTNIREWSEKLPYVPHLAVIMVGDNPASRTYISGKIRDCSECGFESHVHFFTDRTTENELVKLIEHLNRAPSVHGIIVQLPLPSHINPHYVISAIDPGKDVDCLHPLNVANNVIHQGRGPTPCTPAGIMRLLQEYRCDLNGKRAVVIGRSDIVGTPMAFMLQHGNATVTVCHSHTNDLAWVTHQADILV